MQVDAKFVHIIDFEGNKLELCELNEIENEKLGKQPGSQSVNKILQ